MRSIVAGILLSTMLLLTGFAYVLAGHTEQPLISQDRQASKILCLNHEMSGELFDVSISPVYDWIHAGQQGIDFTVTNKTGDDIVIDWDKTLHHRRSEVEVSKDESNPSMEERSERSYDVVAPGAKFSRTLWPRSSSPKAGRLDNLSTFLTARTDKGIERHEEIVLDIRGEERICSK